jgi:NADP-dependent 3-hydroxy acid dehydrogenase YdfG
MTHQHQSLDDFWSRIDILVLNAGLAVGLEHVVDTPPEHVDQMFDTNVKGVLNFLRTVVPGMKIRNSGTIVVVGSIAGREVYPGGGIYCASKHAVSFFCFGVDSSGLLTWFPLQISRWMRLCEHSASS